MIPRMPPMAPKIVMIAPAMMHAHEAQKCQLVILGFFTSSQKMEGREYVVGPKPTAHSQNVKRVLCQCHAVLWLCEVACDREDTRLLHTP